MTRLIVIVQAFLCAMVSANFEKCTDTPSPFWKTAGGKQPSYFRKCFEWSGKERCYFLYVPETAQKGKPVPLVVNLHGGGGCANTAMVSTGAVWAKAAEERGLVIAFPQGYENADSKASLLGKVGSPTEETMKDYRGVPFTFGMWRHGAYCCGTDAKVDDVGFIEQILAQEVAQKNPKVAGATDTPGYLVDATRFYVTGFSNGAGMAQEVAFRKPEIVAAVTVGSFYLYEPDSVIGAVGNGTGVLGAPVPVLAYHGDADADPFAKYTETKQYPDYDDSLPAFASSFDRNQRVWPQLNGCDSKDVTATNGKASSVLGMKETTFTSKKYNACNGGVVNQFVTLKGVDHYKNVGYFAPEIVDFALKNSKEGAADAIAAVKVVDLTTNSYYSSVSVVTLNLLSVAAASLLVLLV